MANQQSKKGRPAKAVTKGFRLNAHRVAIILGLISTFGVLAASAIGNWDKLRGNQPAQIASDTTGDLLAYNEQRRTLVEGAFDQALTHIQEAEKQAAGPEAETLRNFAVVVRENKAKVQRQYDRVLGAIKEKKPIQADINKTELNTIIADTQKEYDETRAGVWRAMCREYNSHRDPTKPLSANRSLDKYITGDIGKGRKMVSDFCATSQNIGLPLPEMTFPMGRNQQMLPDFLAAGGRKKLRLEDQRPKLR